MAIISIIVPVYEVEKYLRRCVESALNQTFSDFELILVDDGSPDKCGMICDEYALTDSRIVVIHKENGGISDARNAGIEWVLKNSQSEWIMFLDSDDTIHKRALEVMFHANMVNHTKLATARLRLTNIEDREDSLIDDVAIIKSAEDAWGEGCCAVSACCKLYHKSLFGDIRFPVGKIHEDTYTTYKLVFKANNISIITSTLYFYCDNSNSITRKEWDPKRLDVIEAFNEQLVFFDQYDYPKAYERSCHEALTYYAMMIKEINKKKYPQECKRVRKEIKRLLKQNKSRLAFSPIKNSYYYESAYPVAMKYYWYFNALKNKLFKRRKNRQ